MANASGPKSDFVSMNSLRLSPPQSLTPCGKRPHFVDVPTDFLCPVCEQVLQRPMQTDCGHLICEECLDSLLLHEDPVPCPGGEEFCLQLTRDPPNVRTDYYANRKVRSFSVYCTNVECQQSMPWSKLEEHLSKCDFSLIPCPHTMRGCIEIMPPGDIVIHSKVCPYRPSGCMYCDMVVTHREMTHHHQNDCLEYPVFCPYRCQSSSFTRQQMEAHKDACPARPIEYDCSYKSFGCDFRGLKADLDQHMTTWAQKHLELVTVKVAGLDLENASLVNQIDEVRCQGENVGHQLNECRNSISAVQTSTGQMEKGIRVMQQIVITNTKKVDALDNKLKQFGDDLTAIRAFLKKLTEERHNRTEPAVNDNPDTTAHIEDLERQMVQLNIQLADIGVRLNTPSGSVGLDQRPWRISNFSDHRLQAEAGNERFINSPPFYTHQGMYHVRLRVYPCGDGQGHGSHISLYLQILKGDYDNVIPWPFNFCVEFELLDQRHGRKHIQDVFYPDGKSTSFQRPESGSEENIPSGAPTFAPLMQLDKPNSLYLVDDTIFIRFTLTKIEAQFHPRP